MIVSRKLESIQQCRAGTVFASFLAVDDNGREWRRSRSRFVNEVGAKAALDVYDWTVQIRQKELQDAQEDVEEGRLSSLNTQEYKQRLITRLKEVRDRLNHYVLLRDRLKAALDRVNG